MSPIVMQNNDVCFISITFGKPWVIKYYVIQRNHSKESQLSVSCTFPIICTRRRRRHERGYGIRIPFTPYRFLSPTFYTYIHQKSGIGFHTKNIFHLFIFIPCFICQPVLQETCAQTEFWCSACVWFDEMMMIREIKKRPYPTHLCINQSYCALKMT